jgi:hypothetical protein
MLYRPSKDYRYYRLRDVLCKVGVTTNAMNNQTYNCSLMYEVINNNFANTFARFHAVQTDLKGRYWNARINDSY